MYLLVDHIAHWSSGSGGVGHRKNTGQETGCSWRCPPQIVGGGPGLAGGSQGLAARDGRGRRKGILGCMILGPKWTLHEFQNSPLIMGSPRVGFLAVDLLAPKLMRSPCPATVDSQFAHTLCSVSLGASLGLPAPVSEGIHPFLHWKG